MGKLFVIGIGPGDSDFLSDAAKKALHSCSLIIGYTVYVKLIHHLFPEKQIIESGMRKEIERCQLALDKTQNGETVALICSGDAGIYGMAGLVYELSSSFPSVHIEVIPGITAATAGAALLGAPLMNDFAVISLSNLLTPQNEINKRLSAAAQGNLCICLYNPASSTRPHVLRDACRIILTYRSPETVCGITRNIGRHNQSVRFTSLAELEREHQMFLAPLLAAFDSVDPHKLTGGRPCDQCSAVRELFFRDLPLEKQNLAGEGESGLSLSGDAVFSALKKAEDGNGDILRIYNPERHETGVNLHLPSGFRARAVRLDETPLDSGEEFLESSPVILPAASILTLQLMKA